MEAEENFYPGELQGCQQAEAFLSHYQPSCQQSLQECGLDDRMSYEGCLQVQALPLGLRCKAQIPRASPAVPSPL